MTKLLRERPWIWLILGVLLTTAAHLRAGVGLLAWLAPIPWLAYLRGTAGWRSRLLFVLAQCVAWTFAVLKIATAPVPAAMAPAFGVPIGLILALPYLGWAWIRPRVPGALAPLAFAALAVAVEWIQHAATPLGSWGAMAYTQLDHLALLQLASVTGMAGVSFLVYWAGALAEQALATGVAANRRPAVAFAILLVGVVAFGQLRLAGAAAGPGGALVAAVGTDSTVSGLPLPSRAETARWDAALLRRTRQAARAGARLVVWTEAATMVRPAEEAAWLRRLRGEVARLGVHLVAAYVVPLPGARFRYENKYVWILPDGRVHHRYLKHRPVPGEPAVVGTAPFQAVDTELGRATGAICYDYDFPRLARAHFDLGVDLVVLPSSDWKGIDPIHTRMAALRAIEGGTSLVRSTRWGLSAVVDPYGRIRGQLSHFDAGERIVLATIPRRGVPTIYRRVGDLFVLLCALLWLAACGLAFGAWLRSRAAHRALYRPGGPRYPRPDARPPIAA